MKTCTACGEEKDLEAFAKGRAGKFGRISRCRSCMKAVSRARYVAKREQLCAQAKAWRESNAERVKAHDAARLQEAIASGRSAAWLRAYRLANPEKVKAHKQVAKAVRKGVLVPPAACTWCGRSEQALVAHHHSYDPKFWLDVAFICPPCHVQHHAQERVAS